MRALLENLFSEVRKISESVFFEADVKCQQILPRPFQHLTIERENEVIVSFYLE